MFDPRVALAVILTLFVSLLHAGGIPHAAAPAVTPHTQGIYLPQRSAARPGRYLRPPHAAEQPPQPPAAAKKPHTAHSPGRDH